MTHARVRGELLFPRRARLFAAPGLSIQIFGASHVGIQQGLCNKNRKALAKPCKTQNTLTRNPSSLAQTLRLGRNFAFSRLPEGTVEDGTSLAMTRRRALCGECRAYRGLLIGHLVTRFFEKGSY